MRRNTDGWGGASWFRSGMRGCLLVFVLVNLILADALVWFAIAQGWP